MTGRPIEVRDPAFPPTDSGILGPDPPPDDLSIVVSVGASLFDDRYGLADRRPRELVQMPFLANDRLDPERSHGDLLLTVQAEHSDTVLFALRQLMRRTRRTLLLKWVVEGFNRRSSPTDRTTGSPRNLLGFVDGTANLQLSQAGPARPPRLDRRHRRRARLDRRRQLPRRSGRSGCSWSSGTARRSPSRRRSSGGASPTGAPLDGVHETDVPDYAADPEGELTPLDAHIRRANPRTPETQANLILRRGFSYSRGFDGAGQLDQGLAFVSYQRSLAEGFLAVQSRLTGEGLEEYIRGEGGGFFFALPGARPGGHLGDGIFA